MLGEAIEGGADQIVGVLLLPLGWLLYQVATHYQRVVSGTAVNAPNQPAEAQSTAEDPLDELASSHPIVYLATDLGFLLVISVLVLFEADLHRMYREHKVRTRGYRPLKDSQSFKMYGSFKQAVVGVSTALNFSKPLKLMRDATLRRELIKTIDAAEELQLKVRVPGLGRTWRHAMAVAPCAPLPSSHSPRPASLVPLPSSRFPRPTPLVPLPSSRFPRPLLAPPSPPPLLSLSFPLLPLSFPLLPSPSPEGATGAPTHLSPAALLALAPQMDVRESTADSGAQPRSSKAASEGGAGRGGANTVGQSGGESTGGGEAAAEDLAVAQLRLYQTRRAKLQTALQRHYSSRFHLSPERQKSRARADEGCISRCTHSVLFKAFRRALNGLVTVWLYFMDVISDVQVTPLLHSALTPAL